MKIHFDSSRISCEKLSIPKASKYHEKRICFVEYLDESQNLVANSLSAIQFTFYLHFLVWFDHMEYCQIPVAQLVSEIPRLELRVCVVHRAAINTKRIDHKYQQFH